MPEHLLALELGPVVQIISAARKTRDMFFGSWMMSECAKSAAKGAALACQPNNGHENLIVPSIDCLDELEIPAMAMGDEILVLVPENVQPRAVADAARYAAHDRWVELANAAVATTPKALVDFDIWNSQVKSANETFKLRPDIAGEVIEVFSAWTPLEGDYRECVVKVKQLLQARTATRNFAPATGNDAGRRKSSLDGRRSSVLVQKLDAAPIANTRLRLNRGEQLDALAVTKRRGSIQPAIGAVAARLNYPSTARIAADPWIRGASSRCPDLFRALVRECELLAQHPGDDDDPVLGRVSVDQGQFPFYPSYAPFPFEGSILFENRHHEFLFEAGNVDANRLTEFKSRLASLTSKKNVSHPAPYYAVLVADGDCVGATLNKCGNADQHQDFSRALSEFAEGVREVVSEHCGALIFAAGEDISAFLPLDTAVDCANALRLEFSERMSPISDPSHPMTLSVGISIGHFLDALEDTMDAARSMEHAAKSVPGKNSLAVELRTRGGAPICFACPWTRDPIQRLATFGKLLSEKLLPEKVAYELKTLSTHYNLWPSKEPEDQAARTAAMKADIGRLLSGKSQSAGEIVSPFLDELGHPDDVIDLGNLIIIAGHIQGAKRQASVEVET